MNTKIRYDLDSLELANGDFGYPITIFCSSNCHDIIIKFQYFIIKKMFDDIFNTYSTKKE